MMGGSDLGVSVLRPDRCCRASFTLTVWPLPLLLVNCLRNLLGSLPGLVNFLKGMHMASLRVGMQEPEGQRELRCCLGPGHSSSFLPFSAHWRRTTTSSQHPRELELATVFWRQDGKQFVTQLRSPKWTLKTEESPRALEGKGRCQLPEESRGTWERSYLKFSTILGIVQALTRSCQGFSLITQIWNICQLFIKNTQNELEGKRGWV